MQLFGPPRRCCVAAECLSSDDEDNNDDLDDETPTLFLNQGIECKGSSPHFVCNKCLSMHVKFESQKPIGDLIKRDAQIMCPCSQKVSRLMI